MSKKKVVCASALFLLSNTVKQEFVSKWPIELCKHICLFQIKYICIICKKKKKTCLLCFAILQVRTNNHVFKYLYVLGNSPSIKANIQRTNPLSQKKRYNTKRSEDPGKRWLWVRPQLHPHSLEQIISLLRSLPAMKWARKHQLLKSSEELKIYTCVCLYVHTRLKYNINSV